MFKDYLPLDWAEVLEGEFSKPYYVKLQQFLTEEYRQYTIYPKVEDIFQALRLTPFQQVKVVILGQDPYHGQNQAHGLSFSVQQGIAAPPSLKNIFHELQDDIGIPIPNHGNLESWAKQGVLLLNTVLTVRAGYAHSHKGKGWEQFTDKVIEVLNGRREPIVYLLWGNAAQSKEKLIDTAKHIILKAPHPSPLSAYKGFFGSKPFSKANNSLHDTGQTEIEWKLPNQ
ncbi:uracil-DNA glycosylase [Caldibacillus lycopersici]|uniref:Uracil-DNA glycosylase n=1 Tax=Perspicuibacillus lycopersici TaxID=1325689 RepID=A0AAE3IRR8_9BACI|nr:uracil-DNA glycosylase [Perspicuibacillus lycopersici]MCU9613007.1 uracil-DNA glycosylase [Perspicuibacillus lycopersici]